MYRILGYLKARVRDNKVFSCLLAVFVLTLLYGLFSQQHFLISDQFERANVSEQVIEGKGFPTVNSSYTQEFPYVYPPLFDLGIAFLSIFSGASILLVYKILGLVVGLLFFLYGYALGRKFFDKDLASLTAFFIAFTPWIMKRELALIPEGVGMLVFLACFYYLLEKRYKIQALVLPFLPLIHLRSFATLSVFYGGISLYYLWKKKTSFRQVTLPIVTTSLSLLLFHSFFLASRTLALENPWLKIFSPLELFSVLIAAALIALPLRLWKEKRFDPMTAWFTFLLVLYLLLWGSFHAFRELAFAFPAIAFLSAYLVQQLSASKKKALKLAGPLLAVLMAAALVGQALYYVSFVPSAFSDRYVSAARFLDQEQGKVVLSDLTTSYTIPYYTENKVVIGAYMEGVPNAGQRLLDSKKFFEDPSARQVLERYSVDYIVLSPSARRLSDKPFKTRLFNQVFDSSFMQVEESRARVN